MSQHITWQKTSLKIVLNGFSSQLLALILAENDLLILTNDKKWSTFLHTHAKEICACDFLQITDLFFRPLFAFFLIELQSRKVIHVGVTRSPTDVWVAQQLREATPFGQVPK